MERISKMWRSALAMVLAICMVLSFCPVAAFAAEEKINYVSIGDSMANGYGFDGYEQTSNDRNVYDFKTGKGMYGEGAYPIQFENYLKSLGYNVNHTKLATSAMLAEDLLYLLGGREEFDDDWGGYKDYVGTYTDADIMDHVQKAVTEADVITMGIGNASFGAFLLHKLTDALGVFGATLDEDEKVNFEDAIGVLELDAKQQALVMKVYNTLENELVKMVPGEMAEEYNLEDVVDLLSYTTATYIVNYKLLVEQILSMNPDVEIVLVGLLNTTYGMNVTDESGNVLLPFGDVMDTLFDLLNAYMSGLPAVLQAQGVAEEAKLYYAAQPNPKFICQEFEKLLDKDWISTDPRLDGATIRDRNIDAFNNSLGDMIGMAVTGAPLTKIKLADVQAYEKIDWALMTEYGDNHWGGFEFSGYDCGSRSPQDVILAVAIYLAIEEAVARSTNTMDIPLSGLIKIAGDLSSVFTALGTPPTDAPESTRTWLLKGLSTNETQGMCKIYGLFKVGNGMSVHPTPAGHDEIAGSVIKAYKKHTVQDETAKNVNVVLGELKGFLEKYGPEAADQAYTLWVEMGYQDLLNDYIAELTTNVTDRYTNYTEVVLPAINSALDALNAQKITLTTELATLKTQLLAKKAELEKVLAEQEITDITPPEFDIDTELGNNEQTQVPENDCAGVGSVADELAAAIADLEHAIAVIEALIADVTADIEDLVALATEIAEGVATLEQTLTDVAAAAQDLKNAVDAVVTVLTDDSAKAASKTFMKAFNAARDAALVAVDTVELLVKTANEDVATIEASIATLEECAKALVAKFDADKEDILGKILADIPTEYQMVIGGSILLVQQTLEENKAAIINKLNVAKDALKVKLDADKDAVLKELAEKKIALDAEYGPQIDEALLQLNTLKDQIDNEIQNKYAELQADAQTQIDALKLDAQTKIDTLNLELQGYMAQLAGDVTDEIREAVQPQIDRINNDIAAINADLACAIEHVNAELKAAHDALVEEVTNTYNDVMTELQNAYDALVDAYNTAVKQLQDAADEAINALQDAYDEAVKQLQDEADKAIQELIDAAQKELDKLGEIGEILSGILDGIYEAIHGDITAAQKAISDVLHGALNSVTDLADALVDLGIDTVNAIVDEVTKVVNDMLHEATHADLELGAESLYIALGDSTAAPESYVEKLAAQLEAEYGVENYTNYAKTGNSVGAEVATVAGREGIADADLITIGFGNATIVETAIRNADSVEYDWAGLVGADLVPYVEDALAEVYAEIANADMSEDMAEFVNSIVEGLAYGAVEYAVELPALIAAIREVNADAVIVIVGQYNPLEDVVLEMGGSTLDLSEYIGYFVDAVAVHGIGYAMITGDAIFVEAPEVDTNNTDTSWSEIDLLKMLMNPKGFEVLNPSESGDTYITNQILGALNITKIEVEEPKVLLGDVNDDGVVDTKDVVRLRKYFADPESTTINFANADVNCDGEVDTKDMVRMRKYFAGEAELG